MCHERTFIEAIHAPVICHVGGSEYNYQQVASSYFLLNFFGVFCGLEDKELMHNVLPSETRCCLIKTITSSSVGTLPVLLEIRVYLDLFLQAVL